jgi:uncharacterized protein YkwD
VARKVKLLRRFQDLVDVEAGMFTRTRLFEAMIFTILFVGLMGFSSLKISAAENVSSEIQYLPLVLKPVEPTPNPVFEEQVINLTNQQRLSHGCNPVTMDARLQTAAEGHSQDMALNDFFSHTGSDGSNAGDRIEAQGYNWSRWGENIAAGYPSPESVVTAWMESSGHRANILNCNFVHIGVGYYYLQNDTGNINYQHYWTQVFASP